MTRLAILGATGSIGRQALDVVGSHPDRLRVTALASARNAPALAALARETGANATALQARDGDDALCDLATRADVDLVLVATPGIAGLAPTLAALRAGKRVALANKEVLVTGGHLVAPLAGGAGDRLRPVDSEHCALWQCLVGERLEDVARVALTASGGPFRARPIDELASVTSEEALRHPTWRMGPKVTIDSATLANKGYEVVETRWLYGIPYERIEIVVHPESVIHALVEFADGSVKAQLAEPDMRLPIQYALLWERAPSPAARLDWSQVRTLRFEGTPDPQRYPCLAAVLDTARSGDLTAMIGLSAADELAVARFLRNEIGFGEIASYLRRGAALGPAQRAPAAPDLGEILGIDRAVRAALETAPALA
ncbi:MAG TPA: 1-deoxy-D-xylulose-5-phosphate reductoisomerase [Candidatus Limnocylindria bacterium]|nr:1-deoxy-D-xylulose-5-phosphate reductoisomerase [Candidatus Limnocylindria bacterium]